MPIQMVCDSTPSIVSAAIRDALHTGGASNGRTPSSSGLGCSSTANGGSGSSATMANKQAFRRAAPIDNDYDNNDEEDDPSDLVEFISQSLRQGQQEKPITYEEGPSYSASMDKLKSKYIVLKAIPNDVPGGGSSQTNPPSSYAAGAGLSIHASKSSTGPAALNANGGTKYGSASQSPNASKPSATTIQQNGVPATANSAAGRMDASNTLPTPKRTLFSRDNVQIGWKTTGRKWLVGAGMMNLGNTCYLNSILQALFHVPAIANWLLSDEAHRAKCDDGGSGGSCIICAVAKTLLESQTNQIAIRPHLVYSKLRLVCKHLLPGRQEDAHEFLRYLVEAMEKSFLGRNKNNKELDQYSKETTPLNQILGGYLRTEVKCLSCQHVSTTFQHFEDILLDIRKANSIDEALELYFARERLEEMGYKCEACKRRVAATKQFSLERAPFVLCVQLKRFSVLGGKINKHVELRSKLDLTPYSSPAMRTNGGKLTYRLTSMVTHLGSTQHCGHYTAIGNTDSSGYYVFDDSSVRPIGVPNVMSTNAYILFYELESAAAGAVGLPNGTCRPKATVSVGGQPSSTATLTSMGHLSNGAAVAGSSGTSGAGGGGGGGGGGAGSGGTPGKVTNSSPLRVLGAGSGHGPAGGFVPSKLEQKSGFIGPVLPSPSAHATTDSGSTAAGVTASGSVKLPDALSSPSSTTSTLSPLCSPSKPTPASNAAKCPKLAPTVLNGTHAAEPRTKSSLSTPLLASMPKLQFSSPAKSNGGASSSANVSLVPYGSDDTSGTSDEDEDSAQSAGKSLVLTNGGGNSKRTKFQAPFANGKRPTKNGKDADDVDGDDDVDEDEDEDERTEMGASRSPQMIKTKAGIWKVSKSSTADQLSYPDSGSASSSKSSSPATSGGSSPAGYVAGSKSKPTALRAGGAPGNTSAINGHSRHNAGVAGVAGPLGKHRPPGGSSGGFHHSNGTGAANRSASPDGSGGGATVQALLKYSHRGYGAPVKSWSGQQTAMEQELANERREERKRQIEDDRETEMDRGRIKKTKPAGNVPAAANGGPNPFQQYQNGGGGKWTANRSGTGNHFHGHHQNNYRAGGGGGYYHNGNGHRHHGGASGGFRNGGRRFGGGRNGGGFHTKAHHHHQRSESGGGMAGAGGSNGFYHR